jgi:spore coat polysaccharide biosynthesis protein SpsF
VDTIILAILQARTSPSRLPGKVLKPIMGAPMLLRQLERLSTVKSVDKLLVATSTDKSDDPIETLCRDSQYLFYRGSLEDVLDRFYQAALPFRPEHVVRLTGDCPLADSEIIDAVVNMHLLENNDYTSNTVEPTFPDGLDVEVMKFKCLREAWENANLASQREHVTPYLYKNPDKYKIGSYKNNQDLSYLRWTVDEQSDYELVVNIYEELYNFNGHFNIRDILALLVKRPELRSFNLQYKRNEGYKAALKQDENS